MKQFKLSTKPYDTHKVYKKTHVEIEPGVTILVGCNGSGKTTFLHRIKSDLDKYDVPVSFYNNIESRQDAVSCHILKGKSAEAIKIIQSSEGEGIMITVGELASNLARFVEDGVPVSENPISNAMLRAIFGGEDKENKIGERWILIDSIDSGLSIDNIILFKELFNVVINDCKSKGITPYIVVSANSYELCEGQKCFDVQGGKYVKFKNYNSYKKFIMKTRDYKFKQIDKYNDEIKSCKES